MTEPMTITRLSADRYEIRGVTLLRVVDGRWGVFATREVDTDLAYPLFVRDTLEDAFAWTADAITMMSPADA